MSERNDDVRIMRSVLFLCVDISWYEFDVYVVDHCSIHIMHYNNYYSSPVATCKIYTT